MKKLLLIAVTMLMLFSLVSISADTANGTMSVTGTTTTKNGNLAIVKVSASSQTSANTIYGTVSYDSTVLAIFEVVKSDNLSGWTFDIDTSTVGQIKFSGTHNSGGDGPIAQDRLLFTVKFIVKNASSNSVTITANAKGKVKDTIITTEEYVTNSEEIEQAIKYNEEHPDDPIEVPEKKFEVIENKQTIDKEIDFTKATHTINITNPKSSDTYLKSITVDGGNLSPAFSKLTTAYKVTIDAEKDIIIDYIKEDEKATVVIQEEKNNQIVITVTAEDGTANAYVLTIVRQKNYDSSNPGSEDQSTPPSIMPISPAGTLGIDDSTKVLLYGGGAVSLIGIAIGAIFVIMGAKEE